jgi:transglutaminase-like putative cysteine protease
MAKQSKQPVDWFLLIMMVVLIMASAWTMPAADWADNLNILPFLAILSVLFGAALARSRFPGWIATIFGWSYGIFLIGWQLGLTLDQAMIWRDRLQVLVGRFSFYLSIIVRGGSNADPLMFVLLMALLYWALGLSAGWVVFRRNQAWAAVIPAGLVVLINVYNYRGRSNLDWYLAFYLFVALVVVARVEYSQKFDFWQKLRARVPSDASYRISQAGLITAFLVVTLAWGAPAMARYDSLSDFWHSVTQPWREFREDLGDIVGDLRGYTPVGVEFYGSTLRLGEGYQPDEDLLFLADPERFPSNSSRFYWRQTVYETYREDGLWIETPSTTHPFDPAIGDLTLEANQGREVIEIVFSPQRRAIRSLMHSSQPVWLNRSASVHAILDDAGLPVDIVGVRSQLSVAQGEPVRMRSNIPIPSANELRLAGQDYPEWVTERYLQLPSTITPRTIELAQTITADLETPYEQAVAITRWLRSNIEYSRTIEAPPEDVEPIDWFLFDYQIGYCDYYASAEVVLLRSLGIPARLAGGYARGEYDAAEGIYSVTGLDSHSWPEVYFPGIGWVEFEPTVSQDVLIRPELTDEEASLLENDDLGDPFEEITEEERLQDLIEPDETVAPLDVSVLTRPQWVRMIAVSLLAVVVAAVWLHSQPDRWSRAVRIFNRGFEFIGVSPPARLRPRSTYPLTPIALVYERWTVWLHRLGLTLSSTQTPFERARVFGAAVPDEAESGWEIVKAYVNERFGGQTVTDQEVRQLWHGMSARLRLAWLWKLTERWRD